MDMRDLEAEKIEGTIERPAQANERQQALDAAPPPLVGDVHGQLGPEDLPEEETAVAQAGAGHVDIKEVDGSRGKILEWKVDKAAQDRLSAAAAAAVDAAGGKNRTGQPMLRRTRKRGSPSGDGVAYPGSLVNGFPQELGHWALEQKGLCALARDSYPGHLALPQTAPQHMGGTSNFGLGSEQEMHVAAWPASVQIKAPSAERQDQQQIQKELQARNKQAQSKGRSKKAVQETAPEAANVRQSPLKIQGCPLSEYMKWADLFVYNLNNTSDGGAQPAPQADRQQLGAGPGPPRLERAPSAYKRPHTQHTGALSLNQQFADILPQDDLRPPKRQCMDNRAPNSARHHSMPMPSGHMPFAHASPFTAASSARSLGAGFHRGHLGGGAQGLGGFAPGSQELSHLLAQIAQVAAGQGPMAAPHYAPMPAAMDNGAATKSAVGAVQQQLLALLATLASGSNPAAHAVAAGHAEQARQQQQIMIDMWASLLRCGGVPGLVAAPFPGANGGLGPPLGPPPHSMPALHAVAAAAAAAQQHHAEVLAVQGFADAFQQGVAGPLMPPMSSVLAARTESAPLPCRANGGGVPPAGPPAVGSSARPSAFKAVSPERAPSSGGPCPTRGPSPPGPAASGSMP